MMNMKCSNLFLCSSANLAGVVIAPSNLVSKRWTEFFRVANVKTVTTFAEFYWNAIRAIYTVIPALYQTGGFSYWRAASSTLNLYCVVVSIIFPASPSAFSRPLPLAFFAAKGVFGYFEKVAKSKILFSTVLAGCHEFMAFLSLPRVTAYILALPPAIVILLKSLSASTRALYKRLFCIHRTSVPQKYNMSKTSFDATRRYGNA